MLKLPYVPSFKIIHISPLKISIHSNNIIEHISKKLDIPNNLGISNMLVSKDADIFKFFLSNFKVGVSEHVFLKSLRYAMRRNFLALKLKILFVIHLIQNKFFLVN